MATTTADIRLLGSFASPFVLRVQISLNIKSISNYQFIEEDLLNKSELLLESNPVYKKIPVFIHADKIICESLVIVQYIDDVWTNAPSILPSDPHEAASARFWAVYIDDKLFPPLYAVVTSPAEEVRRTALELLIEGLVVMEDAYKKCSSGKKYFSGDKIGFVDIALGCFLGWYKAIEKWTDRKLLDEVKTPGLYRWAEDFCADDAVKDVLPETDKLIEFAKVLRMAKLSAQDEN